MTAPTKRTSSLAGDGVVTADGGRDTDRFASVDEALRDAHTLFRTAFDNAPIGMAIVSLDGRWIEVNDALCNIVRRPRAALVGERVYDVTHPDDAAEQRRFDERLVRGEIDHYELEKRYVLEGSRAIWARVAVSLVRTDTGEPRFFLGQIHEITDEKRAAEELKRKNELYEALLRAQSDLGEGVSIIDLETMRFMYVNDALCELHGYSEHELLALPSVSALIPHEAQQDIEERRRQRLDGNPPPQRRVQEVMRKDGTRLTVEVATKPIDEWRVVTIARDITARVRADRERAELESRLQQAQRLESVGQLAGGIAHDFNNLLAVVLNYATYVRDELPPDAPLRREVEEIRTAAERASALTHQLLVFSRREQLEPEVAELGSVVRDVGGLLRGAVGERVCLVLETSEDAMPVTVARGQVEQILLNLAVNAHYAMPDGGTLTVATYPCALDDEHCRVHPDTAPGPAACMRVSDTGCGMDVHVAARALEPFFTTKPRGQGTGLGLATVYAIVTQAGGNIDVESSPGTGTIVTIWLPLASADAPEHVRG